MGGIVMHKPKSPGDILDEFQPIAGSDIFEWELSEWEMKDQLDTYGFVYKCVVDNTSNPSEWLSFETAFSRNAIPAIMNCFESHLLNGVVTLAYPEQGMSPNDIASFVHRATMHPQAKDIQELRLITRNPYLVSDAKSYNVRIVQLENAPSSADSTYYVPKHSDDDDKEDRLRIARRDPYFIKNEKHALFFNFSATEDRMTGIYLGEDPLFVYWYTIDDLFGKKGEKVKMYRTPHKTIWHDLNAVMLTNKELKPILKIMEGGGGKKEIREHLKAQKKK